MSYDPTVALIVVDVQNDFVDPDGSLAVPGATDAVPAINRELRAAATTGAAIAVTRDWHPAETPHFIPQGGIWPVHCVAGTWGAELVPDLDISGIPDVVRIEKGTAGEDGYSAFSVQDPLSGRRNDTLLAAALVDRSVESVVVTGIALDVCVRATILDAIDLGYPVTLVADATAAVNLEPGDDLRTVAELAVRGVSVV